MLRIRSAPGHFPGYRTDILPADLIEKTFFKKKIAVFYYDEVCTILSINCKCCAIIYQASVATRLSAGNLSVIMKIHFCH